MNTNTLLWLVVLFLGGSILFGTLRRLTDGESTLVVVGVQLGALAVVILGLVIWMRTQSRE
jgi:hypothetical protein